MPHFADVYRPCSLAQAALAVLLVQLNNCIASSPLLTLMFSKLSPQLARACTPAPCRHSIGSKSEFDFFGYARESLEEDLSHLVGLSLPIWFIIVISILLSWVLGWSVWVFTIISGMPLLPHMQCCSALRSLTAHHDWPSRPARLECKLY